jgi:hypothetical protein
MGKVSASRREEHESKIRRPRPTPRLTALGFDGFPTPQGVGLGRDRAL